jgi:hypothetical protein
MTNFYSQATATILYLQNVATGEYATVLLEGDAGRSGFSISVNAILIRTLGKALLFG